jgi:hypothetical protein
VTAREPNRYRTLAGAAEAADKAGERAKAARYYAQLVELTDAADTMRPEIESARRFVQR